MLIQHEATGAFAYVPGLFPVNTSTEPVALPILSMNFGGTITNANATPAGSLRAFGAAVGKGHLTWKTEANGVHDIWLFDDKTAVALAVNTTIPVAFLANPEGFLILKSDGSAGS